MPLLQILTSEEDWRSHVLRQSKAKYPHGHIPEREKKRNRKKEEKKKDCPPALRSGLSRFCLRKLCPQGFIFDGQTALPPDLDGPTETGYLCESFLFLKTVLYCIGSIRYPHLSATLRIFSKSKGQLSPNSSETRNSIPSELIKGSLNFQRCSHCLSFSFSF